MTYHLVCVHEFGQYSRGQIVTDPDEVARLRVDRDHHFVRREVPEPATEPGASAPVSFIEPAE